SVDAYSFLCVRGTPLGLPEVPEVYKIIAKSSSSFIEDCTFPLSLFPISSNLIYVSPSKLTNLKSLFNFITFRVLLFFFCRSILLVSVGLSCYCCYVEGTLVWLQHHVCNT